MVFGDRKDSLVLVRAWIWHKKCGCRPDLINRKWICWVLFSWCLPHWMPSGQQIDPFRTGSRVNCAGTLIFMAPPQFAVPTVKTDTSSAEAGEHNREALCFGNCCCNTKYSSESAVAGARLICPSREDYKARPWQCPAEPLLTLSKGQARELPCALTPLLNSSSSASYQAQQVFLVNGRTALHCGSLINKRVCLFLGAIRAPSSSS